MLRKVLSYVFALMIMIGAVKGVFLLASIGIVGLCVSMAPTISQLKNYRDPAPVQHNTDNRVAFFTFGITPTLNPEDIDPNKEFYTGNCESQDLLEVLMPLSIKNGHWVAVPWNTLVASFYKREKLTEKTSDRRVPPMFDIPRDPLKDFWMHRTEHTLIEGIEHAMFNGLILILPGRFDDFIVLTDKAIKLFEIECEGDDMS